MEDLVDIQDGVVALESALAIGMKFPFATDVVAVLLLAEVVEVDVLTVFLMVVDKAIVFL